VAEIRKQKDGIETQLHKGTNGVFDVVLDGNLIFSKKQQGRFPEPQEILDKMPV
jgi:selT/selW/selH-like putative selenoprotein